MQILVFGHIPSWAGGRQESGLANVIYQLAKHESEIGGNEVIMAATDCFVEKRMDGNLEVLGWTKKKLIKFILTNPISSVSSLHQMLRLKKRYPMKERTIGLYFKRLFLQRVLQDYVPDVVHLHGIASVWYLDLIPKQTKIAVTFHGMCGMDKNLDQYEVMFKMERDVFQSSRVNEFFFICTQLVGQFKDSYGENGKRNPVIFNSYDNRQFYYHKGEADHVRSGRGTAVQNKEILLCTVASLSDRKGQLRVLSGLTLLPDRKEFKYVCIGAGTEDYIRQLNEYAKENQIDFEYLGKMPPQEIRKHLYEADYMIMPSSSEGFGLTYLEAIACGVPVILPKDIPIAAESKLINVKNSIMLDDCSSKSIASVLSHIEDYHFDSQEVADTISQLTWDDVAREYINCFENL